MRTLEGPELPSFFVNNGLSSQDLTKCLDFINDCLSGHAHKPLIEQGGCSFTLVAKNERCDSPVEGQDVDSAKTIIQLRLARHAVNMSLAVEASRIFAPLVPRTSELGRIHVDNGGLLQCCTMSFMPGTTVSDLLPKSKTLSALEIERMRTLVVSFAQFYARSYIASTTCKHKMPCTGKVGSSILQRLQWLERKLPSAPLRAVARRTLSAVQEGGLDCLPVSLSHGDLLPSNILVEPSTWEITGIVDWAEAEYLPFGMNSYGLEYLLGQLVLDKGVDKPHFIYYSQACELRKLFWTTLTSIVPGLGIETHYSAAILARTVGILLWHGIAWDDGKIDRVVDCNDDLEELAYLEALLHTVCEENS